MRSGDVRRLLQEWFARELGSAPAADPRRGGQCLSVPEITDLAAGRWSASAEQQEHVARCTWCSRALEAARRLAGGDASIGVPVDSAPVGEWPDALRDRLAAWLRATADADDEPAAAHFDHDGVLHVSRRGMGADGPVTVSLLWWGAVIRLGRGMVQDGMLELEVALPALGLRDVAIPSSALLVEPESVTEDRA